MPATAPTATRASLPQQGPGNLVDPRTLMSIRNLELRARIVVEGFWSGLHRSPYHGFSVEFTEYRQYSPGDDPRYLDWRLYARTDRYYLKKFEDETNLRCHLLVDGSRSMTYGSIGYTKSEYANTLAATLGYFLYLQGDGVGLMTFDEKIRDYLPARHRTGHLRHLMLALEKPAGGKSTDLAAPLRRIVEIVRKRGMMILVSDFLAPVAELERQFAALAACGHELVVFQILDPEEVEFRADKDALYYDLESGRDLYIDPVSVRADYQSKLTAHNAALDAVCSKLGVRCHRLVSNQPLEMALFDFLRERMQRGKRANRRG